MKKTGLRFLKYALAGVLLLPSLANLAFAEEPDPSASPASETGTGERSRIADIIKDGTKCTLNFTLPQFSGEDAERAELLSKLEVDVYKVAGIEQETGYDSYHYKDVATVGEADQAKVDVLKTYVGLKTLDNDKWNELAEIFADASLGTPQTAKASGGSISLSNLDPGLYLIVPRDADHKTEKSDEGYSIADTTVFEYEFKPQLISLPSPSDLRDDKWKIDDKIDSFVMTPSMMTSDAAAEGWLTTVEVMLKPQREYRLSSLVIRKRLDSYQAGRAATFVFRVSGKLDDKTYENVAAITFTNEGGLKQVVLDNIPVNMEITVEELTGAATSFIAVGDTVKTTVINPPNQVAASVEFENDRGNEEPHGHGVDNKFIYNEKSKTWEKDDKLDHSTRYEDIIPIPADNDQTGTDAGEEGTEGNN